MNLHSKHQNYDTVASRGRNNTGNIQSCVGYRVGFGTREVVLCKSYVSREYRMPAV